ncbi:MAG: hypothetical protein DMG58_01715 [Acidobacteria bacterium]|nr:MAG: hypothetical protein DMG58_01715 [Acidobacteriota bacterium]
MTTPLPNSDRGANKQHCKPSDEETVFASSVPTGVFYNQPEIFGYTDKGQEFHYFFVNFRVLEQ